MSDDLKPLIPSKQAQSPKKPADSLTDAGGFPIVEPPPPLPKESLEQFVSEIEQIRASNPSKTPKEVTDLFLESKRARIIAGMLDLAENGGSETSRRAMYERLKDELDGKPSAQPPREEESSEPTTIIINAPRGRKN